MDEVNTLEKRVVITGLGVVSPVGIGKDTFWDALLSGKNGIGPITHFDATEYAARIAGEVKDFDPADYNIDRKEARHMDISTQFAVAAAIVISPLLPSLYINRTKSAMICTNI